MAWGGRPTRCEGWLGVKAPGLGGSPKPSVHLLHPGLRAFFLRPQTRPWAADLGGR